MGRIVVVRESTALFMLVGYYATVCATNTISTGIPRSWTHVHPYLSLSLSSVFLWLFDYFYGHATSWTLPGLGLGREGCAPEHVRLNMPSEATLSQDHSFPNVRCVILTAATTTRRKILGPWLPPPQTPSHTSASSSSLAPPPTPPSPHRNVPLPASRRA